jgi:uncharacterized ion transporter superfamily protein YfcC
MSGGAFNVLVETGALQVLIAKVVAKFGNKEAIFIPLLLLVFAAIATTVCNCIYWIYSCYHYDDKSYGI